jgi:hypothetical protein
MLMRYSVIALPILALLLAGCNINKDIDVPANAHWSNGSSTINGEINVGAGASVDGDLRTINGRIYLADGAQTGDLTTINGNIRLGDGVHAGQLQAVNGEIQLGNNVVATKLATVNGNLILCGTRLDGGLSFYNGSVLLADGSVVHGKLTAKKPNRDDQANTGSSEPVVIIGPHASVDGTISFERPGKLYVSDSAVIHDVEGVTAVRFSGPTPAGVQLPTCPAS